MKCHEFEREPNMFHMLKEKEAIEFSKQTTNTANNIIICTPSEEAVIKRTIDGSLSLINVMDINLSGVKTLISGLSVVSFMPKVKVLVPRGLKVSFNNPLKTPYHNKLYTHVDVVQREVDVDDRIPEYLIYQGLRFEIYIDVDQLKKYNKTIVIKKGTEMVDLEFRPIYYIGATNFPNIDGTWLLQNTELYNTFDTMF